MCTVTEFILYTTYPRNKSSFNALTLGIFPSHIVVIVSYYHSYNIGP
jgi:hypothetical protein